MENPVSDQLAALAHETRLEVFRLLMRRYPQAVPAGEIAAALGLKPNTASSYLTTLRHAGLVSQSRKGTFQLYQVRMPVVQRMFATMLGDFGLNRPELAAPQTTLSPHVSPRRVLFLCSHNSARSIMAEALLRRARPDCEVFSAGTQPATAPHTAAIELLQAEGFDTDGLISKSVETYLDPDVAPMDLVITVCDSAANAMDVSWPGAPLHAHWGVPDPLTPDASMRRVKAVFDQLHRKVDALAGLPLNDIAATTLQSHLDDIGRKHNRGIT